MTSTSADCSSVRALIFDLDGTLIDSKVDLSQSVNATRKHMGLEEITSERIYGFVGNGAQALIRRALGYAAPEEEVNAALAYFLEYYSEHMLDHTVPYPGVEEGLAQLAGRPMAVLTNKPVRFSQLILEGLGMARYFEFVYGGNSFERKKPDPMGVQVLLRDWGLTPRAVMLVGDSEVDVQTARNAGIWACGVTYGLGSKGLEIHKPDLLVNSLTELPKFLNG